MQELIEALKELMSATDHYHNWYCRRPMSEEEYRRLEIARIEAQHAIANTHRRTG